MERSSASSSRPSLPRLATVEDAAILHLPGNGAALALLRRRWAEALDRLNSRLDSFKSRIISSSPTAIATTATPCGVVVEEESERNHATAEEWF
ncbi:unnamed protein product [Linum trigynum]|uniref:Uncharacterized protein n=1 Tax=Linum trigynum TaxID=586398 RepID=A0AAV2ER25_9ROSI